jgi:hypothetical protein
MAPTFEEPSRPGGRMVIFATDRDAMARWRFANSETHRTFDHPELVRPLIRGSFAASEVEACSAMMPLGIRGIIATARKGSR